MRFVAQNDLSETEFGRFAGTRQTGFGEMAIFSSILFFINSAMIEKLFWITPDFAQKRARSQWNTPFLECLFLFFEEGFWFDLKADGKCELFVDGDTATGTWEPSDDGVKFTEGSDSYEAKFVDGRMKFEYEGVEIFFEKEK